MILGYAVTNLHAFDGKDLVKCLCGSNKEIYAYLSVTNYVTENTPPTFVTENTPPTFLWHTARDEEVPVQSSLDFTQALIKHHVPAGRRFCNAGSYL